MNRLSNLIIFLICYGISNVSISNDAVLKEYSENYKKYEDYNSLLYFHDLMHVNMNAADVYSFLGEPIHKPLETVLMYSSNNQTYSEDAGRFLKNGLVIYLCEDDLKLVCDYELGELGE